MTGATDTNHAVFLVGAAEEAGRGSIMRVVAGIRNPVDKTVMKLIVKSFEQRFIETLYIINKLGIEMPLQMHRNVKAGDVDTYMTLTLAFTAFASRRAPMGLLCLASGQKLSLAGCRKQGKEMFAMIEEIKTRLILSAIIPDISEEEAFEEIRKWTPLMKQGLDESEDLHTALQNSGLDHSARQDFWEFLSILKKVQAKIKTMDVGSDTVGALQNAPILALQEPSGVQRFR